MVRKSTTAHWPRFFFALCFIFPALVAYGRGPEDLLDLRKLTKKLKLSPAQQDSARRKISQIQNTLKAFEWDYARMIKGFNCLRELALVSRFDPPNTAATSTEDDIEAHAGIMEHEGGMTREEAEARALEMLDPDHGSLGGMP